MTRTFTLGSVLLFLLSCTGIRPVQLHPPITVPTGFISGYGVEKISATPQQARQAAYRRAMDDLLTRSGLRSYHIFQPSFERSGTDHGFAWVLLGTTEEDIARGWEQFVAWRTERIEEAQKLFQAATGAERVQLLKASLSMLDEAGAGDDSGLLYSQVKAALDAEVTRIEQLDRFQKDFRRLTDNGLLTGAEASLEDAQHAGLDYASYQRCIMELSERRSQADKLIEDGDTLLKADRFKEARVRYEKAGKIDRDNPLAKSRIEMATRFERETRSRHLRETLSFVIPVATQTVEEYFELKREQERRKAEEERRRREEAEREADERRNRQRQQSRRRR